MHRGNGVTRQEILSRIKLAGSATTEELGRELGISPVAVRQHMSTLEAEGTVRTTIERRGLGRPVHRFELTAQGDELFPRSYDRLADMLLDQIEESGGRRAVTKLLKMQRDALAASMAGRLRGKDLYGRAAELAEFQSAGGFMAELRVDGDGALRLVEHNCALCRVADRHRALCESEIEFFRSVVGPEATVERERYILGGDKVCEYRIAPRPLASPVD